MGKMASCREDGVQITDERADEPRQACPDGFRKSQSLGKKMPMWVTETSFSPCDRRLIGRNYPKSTGRFRPLVSYILSFMVGAMMVDQGCGSEVSITVGRRDTHPSLPSDFETVRRKLLYVYSNYAQNARYAGCIVCSCPQVGGEGRDLTA